MHIITLTELQYKNYSQIHSKRNYKQTVEYANMMQSNGYYKLYLGLIDENNNVVGATLILEQNLYGKYKVGYAPNGFLIDFDNKTLLENFTIELKKYLLELNFIYLKLNPNFAYRIFDKNNLVIKCYPNILDNMKNIGYIHHGFDNNFNRFNAILHIKNNIEETYNNLNRNIKRKINDGKLMGITFYKDDNIDKFYELISKKSKKNIDYYRDLQKYFNNENTKFELYFAKLNSETYLENCRSLLNKEKDKNYKLQETIKNINIPKTKKLLNDKMTSDKLINKYQRKVIEASNIFSKYPNGLIIGSCAIIKNDNTIYFIEEGYDDKLRDVYSLSILKWEIIKKYCKLGYKHYNLGTIPPLKNKDNKYYGIYLAKIGFNPRIYEYSGKFDLVINKYLYTIIKKLPQKK